MKIRGNFVVALVMLLFFSGMFVFSLDWSGNSLRFPLLISIAGMACTAGLLVSDFFAVPGRFRKRAEKRSEKDGNDAVSGGATRIIIWLFVLSGTTVIFGFWIGSAFFMLAFLRLFGRENWAVSLGITGLVVAVLYLVLSVAMKMPVYGGYFGLTPY